MLFVLGLTYTRLFHQFAVLFFCYKALRDRGHSAIIVQRMSSEVLRRAELCNRSASSLASERNFTSLIKQKQSSFIVSLLEGTHIWPYD